MEPIWRLRVGEGPLVATAIHDGHELSPDLVEPMALTSEERLREEDPFTGKWTSIAPTRVVGLRSRFEVDLNRARDKAVYRVPADAWGLNVWRAPLSEEQVQRSLEAYDAFYATMHTLFSEIAQAHGKFVVLDIHTYNHRRDGAAAAPADPAGNPQVNIGTGTLDRPRWSSLVDRFIQDLKQVPIPGGALDVRENVKFQGGNFSRWIHESFPDSGCAIAIEFKKFFMDEWTGTLDTASHHAIEEALHATIPGVMQELTALGVAW